MNTALFTSSNRAALKTSEPNVTGSCLQSVSEANRIVEVVRIDPTGSQYISIRPEQCR